MTIANSFAAKFAVATVAVAMALSAFAAPAQAQTTEELQAMINDLLAQVAGLQGQLGGGTAAAAGVCPYTWTRDLSSGATGMDVMKLQQFLNADPDTRVAVSGAGSAGMETEYYGPATGAAVAKFQTKYRADILSPLGLVNATMYFGAGSRAKANALCVAAPVVDDMDDEDMDDEDMDDEDMDDEDEDFELGGAANLDDFETDDASDDEIAEGDEDAPIAEFTVQFENGDAELDRLTVQILADGETDTSNIEPWDVFETLSLWVDGDKVAEKDADDEDDWLDEDDGTFRFTGLGLIGMEDEDLEIILAATVNDGLETSPAEIGNWFVEAQSIRFFDADGVSDDDSSTGDLGGSGQAEFEIQEEGDEDELIVRSNTNDPDATTLQLEDDQTSDWMTIFIFDLDTEDSENDIQVEGLQVDVDATEDGTTPTTTALLIDDARLVVDGEEYDDVTITHGTTGTFVFDLDDEDFFIDAGDRVSVEFQVEFEALTALLEGATVEASTDSGTGLDAEGADNLTGSQLEGSATGEEHTLRTEGAVLSPDSTDEDLKVNDDQTAADDEGVFKVVFDVTAFETDIFVNKSAASGTTMGTAGANFLIEDTNGDAVTDAATTSVASLTSTADTEGTRWIVEEGETETFTLTVEYDPSVAGFYQLQLYSFNFNDTNAAPDTAQRALPSEDYETDALSI